MTTDEAYAEQARKLISTARLALEEAQQYIDGIENSGLREETEKLMEEV